MSFINPIIIHNTDFFNRLNKYFLNYFNLNFVSMMIFPFIIIVEKEDFKDYTNEYNEVLNHEKIHFEQCTETFVLGFYAIMFYEFINNLLKMCNVHTAYTFIRFEREAYDNMKNISYLKYRKKYSWQNYELFPGKIKSNLIKKEN